VYLLIDHLPVSDVAKSMTTHLTSSDTEELPITSVLDQRTSSRRIQQQQSNVYKEDNEKSTRSLSFKSYRYQTPSKTTIKMSHESSQSLSPVHSKSINTQQSNGSILSCKMASINDITEKKSISNIARSYDKRSFKESINQNPISYQTYVNEFC